MNSNNNFDSNIENTKISFYLICIYVLFFSSIIVLSISGFVYYTGAIDSMFNTNPLSAEEFIEIDESPESSNIVWSNSHTEFDTIYVMLETPDGTITHHQLDFVGDSVSLNTKPMGTQITIYISNETINTNKATYKDYNINYNNILDLDSINIIKTDVVRYQVPEKTSYPEPTKEKL